MSSSSSEIPFEETHSPSSYLSEEENTHKMSSDKSLVVDDGFQIPVEELPPATNDSDYEYKHPAGKHLRIPLIEIEMATHNFSDIYLIGSGGYGQVYRAELDLFDSRNLSPIDGMNKGEFPKRRSTVAIKLIFNRADMQAKQGFIAEIEILSKCKHPNVVSLLGFCDEGPEMILIYEYASKGSLDGYLGNINKMTNLTWAKRIQICRDVAYGLNYLHTSAEDKPSILHRDIKSANILLDDNLVAKIADFGLSNLHPAGTQQGSHLVTTGIVGTEVYLDPEYFKTGKLKKKSDIYSLGIVLLEVLCGRLAYDKLSVKDEEGGLASIARKRYNQGRLYEMIDPKLKEVDGELNQDSLDAFYKVAYQCVAVTQDERPLMEVVIKELDKALFFQTNGEFGLRIPLEDILSATNDFADGNLLRQRGPAKVYKGQLLRHGKLIDIIARRLDGMNWQEAELQTEMYMLSKLEHKNLVSVVGFCVENSEKIIIYEHAVHASLEQQLSCPTLTWLQRLKICLGVARVLSHIHCDNIHCGINTSKIFLDQDWEAKVLGFELSTKYPQSWRHRLLLSTHLDTSDYLDRVYFDTGIVTPKYDVYSFGVVLFEILCVNQSLTELATRHFEGGKLYEIIDEGLRKQMDPKSFKIFSDIAYHCLEDLVQRPTMDQVVRELEDALEHQWKHENLEQLAAADEDISSNRLKRKNLERLRIQLSDIKSATENFDKKFCVGSGGFGMVYKAELSHLDIQTLSSTEGTVEDKVPKKRSTVAIKQIFNRQDEQGEQGFLAEIELLSSCKHRNIVSLLGFSRKDREMILVYEFLSNGSLDEYLGSTERKINLTWNQRLQICIDIAEGLKYLHTNTEKKRRIIHRDIKSANILLDENWSAKIADFGLSKFHPANQPASTIQTKTLAGTEVYLDPEYMSTGKYKTESDIYSFGVVLFETLSGRLAYDPVYLAENNKGLAPVARRRFNEGTLKELIDPKIMEEDDEQMFTLNRGPNQDSFDAFSKIAYQCLAETQAKRPTMEVIIKELHNALKFQGETMVLSRFRFSDILLATKNFSETYCIGLDAYSMVYKAEISHFDSNSMPAKRRINVAIKRISSREDGQGKEEFYAEIERRMSYKHPNIVSLLGFCDEGPHTILVYEQASNGSLDDYLRSTSKMSKLTWTLRLQKCLEIARGIHHIHTNMNSQQRTIHGDITRANILFGKNLEAKISYFGLSKLQSAIQDPPTNDNEVYWDPEYEKTGKLEIQSDIYSFGVLLFEIFCGRLADKGFVPMARMHFENGTIKEMIDPKLLEGSDDMVNSNKGLNKDSLDTFINIAYKCLGGTGANRPSMQTVIKELENALNFQENLMKNLQISLKDIKSATDDFSEKKYIASGRYWKTYKGELPHANVEGHTTIVTKRWDNTSAKGDHQFQTELDILSKRKHESVISLVGYCNQMNEKIIVYEHVPNRSLKEHLNGIYLSWMKRLNISIGVASGLAFLHGGDVTLKKVVHRDIKSSSILLTCDWKANVSNLELSSLDLLQHQDMEHANDNAYGTLGYLNPKDAESGFLTEKSDIYSFGVILFEILCGRLAWAKGCVDHSQSLGPLAKKRYEEGKLDVMVFKGIRDQIVPLSYTTFVDIAYKCLRDDANERPEATEVVIQLKKALEFQEEYEIWEPKLPKNYEQIIIAMAETPDNFSIHQKKDLYKMLSDGIFLQNGEMWFSLSSMGKGNTLVSATMFSYKNHRSHKWRSIKKSIPRFNRVAKMMDISNLKIQININTKFLSSDAVYGVHLVFKFCDPRIFSRQRMYVNLKYKMGTETLHAYFARQRDDDGWMMIELWRFSNQKEDDVFEVLLESFSRCYCESGAIYVQGIEFKAIDNMKHEEIERFKGVQQVQKSNLNMDQLGQHLPELSPQSEVNGKKHLILSAKEVLLNPPESRFEHMTEFKRQQVFGIKYKIEIEKLSPFTEYACYLVFKLSEKCRGLYCPVRVLDLIKRRNKQADKIIYFRSPGPLNQHDGNWVPETRKDGWMEVILWKFNSKYKPGKDYIPMNLKLIAYEGTMSGLMICGLEIRPM